MPILRKCSFYRDSKMLSMGPGIGYCDLDSNRTTCKGDVYFCKKIRYSRETSIGTKEQGGKSRVGEEMKCLLFRRRGSSGI